MCVCVCVCVFVFVFVFVCVCVCVCVFVIINRGLLLVHSVVRVVDNKVCASLSITSPLSPRTSLSLLAGVYKLYIHVDECFQYVMQSMVTVA